jgi:hypothetical protein
MSGCGGHTPLSDERVSHLRQVCRSLDLGQRGVALFPLTTLIARRGRFVLKVRHECVYDSGAILVETCAVG